MNMTPAERRQYWADHLRAVRRHVQVWRGMKELLPDADWKAKCDREAESVKMNAKFYMSMAKMMY
jgi:hypothetical protein